MYILLTKLRHVFAGGDEGAYLLTDEALRAFMHHCESRIGDAYFRTPRNTVKEFLNLLAVLDQNREVRWSDLIARVEIAPEGNPDLVPLDNGGYAPAPSTDDDGRDNDGLVTVRL